MSTDDLSVFCSDWQSRIDTLNDNTNTNAQSKFDAERKIDGVAADRIELTFRRTETGTVVDWTFEDYKNGEMKMGTLDVGETDGGKSRGEIWRRGLGSVFPTSRRAMEKEERSTGVSDTSQDDTVLTWVSSNARVSAANTAVSV